MSDKIIPPQLVQFVSHLATQNGAVLSVLRVVKFLYLVDLFYARENSGRTFTGWPWAFVHYGPYCREAMQAIDAAKRSGLIIPLTFESKYDGEEHEAYRGYLDIGSEIEESLPIFVTSPLKAAIKRWADDTPRLLDYVYFETEPMRNAHPGQRLDFSRAHRPIIEKGVKMLSLPKDKLRMARERVDMLRLKYQKEAVAHETQIEAEPRDDEYLKVLMTLDGEPLEIEGLTGEAAIRTTPEDSTN